MKTSVKKKERAAVWIARIVLMLGFLFIFTIPSAYASYPDIARARAEGDFDYDGVSDQNEFQVAMVEQITTGVSKMTTQILTGGGDDNVYHGFYEFVMGDTSNFMSDTFKNTIKACGAFWCIAIAFIHFFNNVERGQDPMEMVFKILIEIGIAGLFIMWSDRIMTAIMDSGTAIIALVAGSGEDIAGSSTATQILKDLTGKETGDFFWQIGTTLKLLIPWVLSWLIQMVTVFLLLQILFEVAIRRAFAPLAIADIYQEGLRSPGARYMKRFFAVFIKMAVCLLIAQIGSELTSTIGGATGLAGTLVYLFQIIIVNFTLIGVMFRAGEFANDIVGA